MKICSGTDTGEKKYYLSWSKFFNNIEELIVNYQIFSLKENFERWNYSRFLLKNIRRVIFRLSENTRLLWPYKQIYAVAIRNFQPQDYSQISLREGLKLIIIGKEGYREGWWKGRIDLNNVSSKLLSVYQNIMNLSHKSYVDCMAYWQHTWLWTERSLNQISRQQWIFLVQY